MDPVTLFQIAGLALQNRKKIESAFKWLNGDQEAALSPDQKIEKIKETLEDIGEIQADQDYIIDSIHTALLRAWIGIGVTLMCALSALGISVYLFFTR